MSAYPIVQSNLFLDCFFVCGTIFSTNFSECTLSMCFNKKSKILQWLIDTFSITWYIQNLPLNPTLLKGDLQSQKKSHIEREEAKDCWVVIYPSKRTSGGRGGILWYHYILMTNIFEREITRESNVLRKVNSFLFHNLMKSHSDDQGSIFEGEKILRSFNGVMVKCNILQCQQTT